MIGYELCPKCWKDTRYEIDKNNMIAQCEHCGEYIVICSNCPHCGDGCGKCEYEAEAAEMNWKYKKSIH